MLADGSVNYQTIDRLAYVLTVLRNQGKEIVLVSSGAIGVGLNRLNLPHRPKSIPEQQAVASVGQPGWGTVAEVHPAGRGDSVWHRAGRGERAGDVR